jgi:hypothetical protein
MNTFTITQPAAISVSFNAANVSCNGGNNGMAAARPTGGVSPYTYLWSTGQTTKLISSLYQGTYTVTVTDANGCTKSGTVVITEPTPLVINSIVVSNDPAHPGNYLITVSASGGTPNIDGTYRYRRCNLNNSGCTSWQLPNVLSNVPAGTYLVKVRDRYLCTVEQEVTVGDEPSMQYMPGDIIYESTYHTKADSTVIETTYVYTPLSVVDFSVYPNPGKEFVWVQGMLDDHQLVHISIHNLSGQLVLQEKIQSPTDALKYQLNTASLNAGLYLITLKTPHTTQSQIWIKTE